MLINRSGDTFPHAPIALDDDGGGGGGGGYSEEELERQAERAVEEGRAIQKIESLLVDNKEQRDKIRELKDQLPAEDEVVLSPDQASKLRELGVLGEDGVETEDLEETLEEGREARQELQQIREKERRREVAETAGVNPDALEMATKALDTDVEYEIQGEGENATVVARPEDGDPQDFDEFAEEHFSSVQKALYDTGSGEYETGNEDNEEAPTGGPSGNAPSTQAGEGNRPAPESDDEDDGPPDGDGRGYRFESSSDAEW